MKNIYIATVTLNVSETDSFGGQTTTDPVHVLPVWADDDDEASTLIERHFARDNGAPGNWVRITDIVLQPALGDPGL